MPELFNPGLPGVSRDLSDGWRRAGWREWDDLTKDEQKAHEDAAAAAQADREKADADRDAALQKLRDAALENANRVAAPETPAEAKPKRTNKAPANGETTKE